MRFEYFSWWCAWGVSLLLAPLLPGVINRVKAWFAGRRGPSVFQLYRDLWKLMKKSVVYSRSSSRVLRWSPAGILAALTAASLLLPLGGVAAPSFFRFDGDLVLFVYWFALVRVLTVLAALDTASAFEGMGASREVQFSALAELPFFAALGVLAMFSGSIELSGVLTVPLSIQGGAAGMVTFLIAAALLMVLLCEACRVPFDDPNTHLELTMIHEAMILDYSGPDLAMVLYGAALKFWLLGSLLVMTLLPFRFGAAGDFAVYFGGMILLAVLVGVLESVMSRCRLVKIPQLLIGAFGLALLALAVGLMFKGGR